MGTGPELAQTAGRDRTWPNWHGDWAGVGTNSRAGQNMAKLAWGLGRSWHKQQGGTTWPNWHGDWARVGKRNGTEHGQIGMGTGPELAQTAGRDRTWPNWHGDWAGIGINSRAGVNMAKLAWDWVGIGINSRAGPDMAKLAWGLGQSWHKQQGGTTWPNWHGDWARVGKRNGTEHGQIGMGTGPELAQTAGRDRTWPNWHGDWAGIGINSRAGVNMAKLAWDWVGIGINSRAGPDMAKLAWGLGRYWHKQQGGTRHGQIGMGLGRSWHKRNGTEHGQIGMGLGRSWHKRNGTEHGQIGMGTGSVLA
ncbi:hypothetical protein niasHT_006911 [Heterodera trifolii]|uniref:Uncharacterized protein n=1 Tax=Heterodera trifolii TaxID=157864 RepID=A0ABD2LMW8_9BILA